MKEMKDMDLFFIVVIILFNFIFSCVDGQRLLFNIKQSEDTYNIFFLKIEAVNSREKNTLTHCTLNSKSV